MILALIIATAQVASTAQTDGTGGPSSDVVMVVAQQLRDANIAITFDRPRRQVSCRVRKPGGDPKIDAAVCQITMECVKQHQRGQMRYGVCMDAAREAFLDEYVAGWEN